MLPSAHRLKGDANFKILARTGRSFFSPLLSMRVMRVPGVSRFGFVVSTKVSKSAVQRNRVRRQLREIVRLDLPRISPGYHVMLIVKQRALGTPYGVLQQEINRLFTDARIYHS